MNKTVLLRWWELIGVGVLCSILGSTILFIALYIFHNTNDANNVAVASCFFYFCDSNCGISCLFV